MKPTGRIPRHHARRLDNGLEVRALRVDGRVDAAVVFAVRAGSRYEPRGQEGISHLLEHMTFRGCRAYPDATRLNLALESLGGHLDATTNVDLTTYELELPSESLHEGLARFARLFDGPTFAGLDVEKRVLREELLEELDEDGRDVDVDNLSRRLLYPDHPLGLPVAGTLTSLEAIDEAALRAYHDGRYVGANGCVTAVGPGDPDALLDALSEAFAWLPTGVRTDVGRPPVPTARAGAVRDTGSQSDVRVSFPALAEADPDRVGLSLLARVLDDGMGSRLPKRLRDELGLVYDAFAGVEAYEDAGVFDVGGSVAHERALDLVTELLALTTALGRAPLPADELEHARRRSLWDLARLAEDPLGLASHTTEHTLLGGDPDLERARAAALAATPEGLAALAARLLRADHAVVAVVGDLGAKADERLSRLLARHARG